MLPIDRIDNKNMNSDEHSTPSSSTATLSRRGSIVKNITINIPPDLLQSGNTLQIEKHWELFVGGHHLPQPPHPIRQAHGLCLVNTQQEKRRSITATHQLQDTTEDRELVQVKVEVPPEILQKGKTITIQKSSTTTDANQQPQLMGNFSDLYSDQHSTESIGANHIHIDIPEELLERGQTILIQKKENVSVVKTDDYHKQQAHHLAGNPFTKRDHLLSKNLMEVTFLVPPELLNNGQTITIRQEDLESIPFNHHHPPISDTNQHQVTNDDSSESGAMWSMEELMLNKTWSPSMLDDGRLLLMRLDFFNQPTILRGDQLKLTLNGHNFRVETDDQQYRGDYRQVTLPPTAQLDELKCQFDGQHRCLNISVPLQ